MHGVLNRQTVLADPLLVAQSDLVAREDHGGSITASEYVDDEETLLFKVKQVADMLQRSKSCTVYAGAGLSRSSGIGDYASKAKGSIAGASAQTTGFVSGIYAKPNAGHRSLVTLQQNGLIDSVISQNHDSLLQKAGFPLDALVEIHGCWHDPSNPPIKFSQSLRPDLFRRIQDIRKQSDMCLCLGTSLSGMNADSIPTTIADRHLSHNSAYPSNGTVVVNLQKTPLDGRAAVRIWATLDHFFELLLLELGLPLSGIPVLRPSFAQPQPHQFQIPYNATTGQRLQNGQTSTLDLNVGSQVMICIPEASNQGCHGVVTGTDKEGNYVMSIEENNGYVARARRVLGRWWLIDNPKVQTFPIVNL